MSRPTKTGRTRPYVVAFQFDGTRKTDPGSGLSWIDHSQPVKGRNTFPNEDQAHVCAAGVARRGGRATVSHVDRDTNVRTDIRVYEPGEGALEHLAGEHCDGYGSCPEAIEHQADCLARHIKPTDTSTPSDVELEMRRELAAILAGNW